MPQVLDYHLPEHLAARRTAQRRENTVQIVATLLAIACFAGAAMFVGPINEIRKERQLVIDPDTIRGLPPDIALLGKLGTFRALAIDWASIRAERLKEEGKTYEALQLHETICALAPRYPKLWAYAAWNMAYNISVSQFTPEARWKWVTNGIEILRDKGIQYNPRSVTLYKELAWIYWHKIGDYLDDEHMNYKRALAVQMELVLGPEPVTVNEQEYFAWFRRIVDAPRDLDGLIASDSQISALVSRLARLDIRPDDSLLEFVARHLRPELRISDLVLEEADIESQHEHRMALLTDPTMSDPLERLLAAIRYRVLHDRLKLDPELMLNLMVDEYGPLDWRNAFSHSLYWASRGDRVAKGIARVDSADAMNTARFVFFSLHQLITRGRISLYPDFDDPFESYIELTPDTRLIPYLYQTYMRLGKEQFGDDPRFREGTPGPNFLVGFISNMHNWIELLYLEGGEANLKMAESFYAWLRVNNPHPDGSTQEQYLQTLDEFVMDDLLEQLQTYRAAGAILRSFIRRALKHFALGQMQSGLTSIIRSRQCYDYWMADTAIDFNDRRRLQPPSVILRDEIVSFMKDDRVDALFKARLWKNLPLEQRQLAYDPLAPFFDRICETRQPPWAVTRAFAEPPGMNVVRRTHPKYRAPARREGVEEGTRYKE